MIDLNLKIVEEAKRINGLELHDRLIAATGIYLNIPILTCDQSILDSDSITAVWK
jgi:predicted nucleic acid-binding protein